MTKQSLNNNQERAATAFNEFQREGSEGFLVRADASNAKDVVRMYEQICDKLGPVDILVCNATPSQPQKTIEAYGWDGF